MKTSSTLLLLAAAGGLFAFIKFYESGQPTTREAASRDDYVLLFDRDKIDGIVITGNADRIELRKEGNLWRLESPLKDRADQNTVAEILTQSESLRKETGLSEKEIDRKKLKELGVAKSNLRLKLLGKDAPPEILFGKDTAVEGKVYVRVDGSNAVSIVTNELRNLVGRKVDDFRDHRLTDLEGGHVNKVAIKTAAGEIELSKQSGLSSDSSLGGLSGHWGLNKPLKARASDAAATDLIGSILNTEILSFAPEKGANLNTYGLSEPRATVTLWSLSQKEQEPVTLEIGAHDEKTGNTYARISPRGAVCLLPGRVERILSLKPNDLRDRHLLRVDLDIVDRLTIAPAGKPKIVLQRREEAWTVAERPAAAGSPSSPLPAASVAPRPANATLVRALVSALQTREISAFVTDVGSDLPKYGLDHPQLKVTFSSYASENTAEGNAGEQPIATVSFGNVENGKVYARVEEEPFVVSIDEAILKEIGVDPAAWRALSLFDYQPRDIVALEVIPEGGKESLSFTRDGKTWTLAGGKGTLVQNTSIESLVNTLAKLSAVRWTGSEDPATLKTPTRTIAFKIRDAKGNGGAPATRRLLLGAPAADGTCPAAIEGESGTAILSAPDVSALRLPLTIVPAEQKSLKENR